MGKLIISIDGSASSGKRRIASFIAKKYNLFHLDSGILYRRLALKIIKDKVDLNIISNLNKYVKSLEHISCRNSINRRKEIISKTSSEIAIYPFVRSFINKQQKIIVYEKLKTHEGCVIDGRDIGSKVFKEAKIKLFIEVDIKIRAKRRHKQLIEMGEKSIYGQILKDIKLRDKLDKNRKSSPLIIPKGSIIINNSFNFKNTTKQINKTLNNLKK